LMEDAKTWSGPRPFVGRGKVREDLAAEVERATTEGGRAVFLLGPTGSGMTACIGVFQEEAFRRFKGLRAQYVDCAHSGARTWAELAQIFTRGHKLKRSLKRVSADWLESIPIAGKILQAVVRTVTVVRGGRVEPRRMRRVREVHDTALAAVRTLLEFEPLEPRLLIMDSLDRGDSEDLAGAAALIRRLPETRTLFLAAVRTVDGRPPPEIADLMLEAERLGRAARIEIRPLSLEDLEDILSKATGAPAPRSWIAWLRRESGGIPGSVWSLLGRLEQEGRLERSGRRWDWVGEPSAEAVSTMQVPSQEWKLNEADRRLMALAACEGQVFHSAVLAQLAGRSELEVEDRLSGLCRIGLLEYQGAPALGDDVTSRYAFRDEADVGAFAAELETDERETSRERVARIQSELGF